MQSLVLLFLALCWGTARASVPICATVPANISYVNEDCLNATHRRVRTGECMDGVLRKERLSIESCHEYAPIPGAVLSANTDFFCHQCEDHRTICSELEAPQACAAHLSDDTFCRQVESIGSFPGCLSTTEFFRAVEYCTSDGTGDASISPKACADEYGPEFFRCMSCQDGLAVCAGTQALECEDINLASSTGSDSGSDADGDSSLDDSSPDDFGSFDCHQFSGDVQFYRQDCFNSTHTVVTSGLCIEGQVQGLSLQTSACGADGEGLGYCHECEGKAVCASTSVEFNICDESNTLRSCSEYYDTVAYSAGCLDEQSFSLSSDSCKGGEGLLQQETSRCGNQFPGFSNCFLDESSGYQLCSVLPKLPYPPVDCLDSEKDVLWSHIECLNSTHTLFRSGRCTGGGLQDSVVQLTACSSNCHECADSRVICSSSDIPEEACSLSMCQTTGATSFSIGCLDASTSYQDAASCIDGQIKVDRLESTCGQRSFSTPHCLACESTSLCVVDQLTTCSSFGLTPSINVPGIPSASTDGIDCGGTTANINYYNESCFNETHVHLVHGECISGEKLNSQMAVLACSDYGEDDSRVYCHECGISVRCSSKKGDTNHACERHATDRTCDGSISDLSGIFGCLNEEIFFSDFAVCQDGVFSSEMNGFRCADVFPAYPYCNTCGNGLNLCVDEKKSCAELGLSSING